MEADEMSVISNIVKEINPKCITILGGPHASFFYDHALENAKIDIVVMGEGEITFIELIKKLLQDQSVENVKGIAFKKNNKIILTPPREFIENLDSIPFPAWDLVDFKKYSTVSSMNAYCAAKPWAIIFTSRGCPFHCAYCHSIFGKKARLRSPENVIAEIELLTQKYRVKEIQIVDDFFNVNLERAKKICDLIIDKKIKIKIAFPDALRGDMIDKELIHKLKEAGCYSIAYAVETASPRIQKLINKNLNLEKVHQAISWTYDEGIITHGYFMLGFPSETREEIESTIKWAVNHPKLLLSVFFSVVIYPRLPLMEIAKSSYPNFDFSQWKLFDLRYWSEKPFYQKATGVNLFKIQRNAYRRFYSSPKKLFIIFLRFPKNIFLFHIIWSGLRSMFISLYKLEKFFYFRDSSFKNMKEKISIIIMIILSLIILKNIIINILSYRYLKLP
jgi:radical SAM superfamily enzyme YgiQ (UPF0313 family)